MSTASTGYDLLGHQPRRVDHQWNPGLFVNPHSYSQDTETVGFPRRARPRKKYALSSFGQCFPNVYYGSGTARLSNSWETPGVKRNWIKRSGGRGEKNASQAGEDRGFVRSGLLSKRGNKNKTMGKFCRITRVTSSQCQGFSPLLFRLPTALAIFKTRG